jgi:hypothetical protein
VIAALKRLSLDHLPSCDARKLFGDVLPGFLASLHRDRDWRLAIAHNSLWRPTIQAIADLASRRHIAVAGLRQQRLGDRAQRASGGV